MPVLREWMMHYPTDWTPPQAGQFMEETTLNLVNQMSIVNTALGPVRTSGIMLTVVLALARKNPVFHKDIEDLMANVFDMIAKTEPMGAEAKQ